MTSEDRGRYRWTSQLCSGTVPALGAQCSARQGRRTVTAMARVGAVAALVCSLVAVSTPSTAGAAASGPLRYATQAGTFEAAFHARPRTDVDKDPSQAFTTVSRLAHGPAMSVIYRHGSGGLKSPY